MKKIILIAVAVAFSSIAFNFSSPKTASAAKICTGTVRRNGPKIAEFFTFANGLTDAEFVSGVQELARENLTTTCSDAEIEKLIEEAKAIIARIETRREEEKLAEEARKKAEEEEARAKEEAEKQRLLNEKNQKSENKNKADEIVEIQTPNTGFKQDKNNLVLIFSAGLAILSVIATTKK